MLTQMRRAFVNLHLVSKDIFDVYRSGHQEPVKLVFRAIRRTLHPPPRRRAFRVLLHTTTEQLCMPNLSQKNDHLVSETRLPGAKLRRQETCGRLCSVF